MTLRPTTPAQQEIADYAKEGLTRRQIAEETGNTIQAVRALGERAGVKFKREIDVTYADRVKDMKPLEAVDYLLAILATFTTKYNTCFEEDYGFKLGGTKALLFRCLHEKTGRSVSHAELFSVLYNSRLGELPSQQVLKSHVAHLRRAIPDRYTIANVWGHGYKLLEMNVIERPN